MIFKQPVHCAHSGSPVANRCCFSDLVSCFFRAGFFSDSTRDAAIERLQLPSQAPPSAQLPSHAGHSSLLSSPRAPPPGPAVRLSFLARTDWVLLLSSDSDWLMTASASDSESGSVARFCF
jgi:hypothetical protein